MWLRIFLRGLETQIVMSNKKKLVRERFRNAVFARDKHSCVMCGKKNVPLDAHHITDRNEMPNGGYIPENGISLCDECHMKAEQFHSTGIPFEGYSPDELYAKIGSSHEEAVRKDND